MIQIWSFWDVEADYLLWLKQLEEWIPSSYCKCSRFDTAEMLARALNWELWEKFRGINSTDIPLIHELMRVMAIEQQAIFKS